MSWALRQLLRDLAKAGIYPIKEDTEMKKTKYAFPTNGVQRDECGKCIFFGGNVDRELRSTICNFPQDAPMGTNEMIPYSYCEEEMNPELKEKRQRRCPCYIDKKTTIDTCRKYILNQLEEADHGEEE